MWKPATLRQHADLEPTAWPGDGLRPRVLVEHHDPTIAAAVGNLLEAEGYEVSTCSGPNERRRRQCPLATGADCPQAEHADAVVFGLDITDEDDRAVLQSWRVLHGNIPMIVELPQSRIPLYREELEGCVPIPRPMTRESLLDAVDRALR